MNRKHIDYMGQCYSISLKLKLKDENKAYKALHDYINKRIGSIEKRLVKNYGYDLTKFEDLLRVVYTGAFNKYKFDPEPYTDGWGRTVYCSSLDASYSWEYVLEDAFRHIAEYIDPRSSLDIWPDEGKVSLRIKNGIIQYI